MARTRTVPWRRPAPANINFDMRRVAGAKEIANAPRYRINIKIKFLLPQGKMSK